MRDPAQVLPIWEGTTNVLSLDLLRAAVKEDALNGLLADLTARLETVSEPSREPGNQRGHRCSDGSCRHRHRDVLPHGSVLLVGPRAHPARG
jgi:hypothetical protein